MVTRLGGGRGLGGCLPFGSRFQVGSGNSRRRRENDDRSRRQISQRAPWQFQHHPFNTTAGRPWRPTPTCWTRAPIPKLASYRGNRVCELRNQRGTSNLLILVRLFNLKFPNESAAI